MSLELLDEYGVEFTLVKADAQRVLGKGIWDKNSVIIEDTTFPVAIGDAIERVLPNGIVDVYEVMDIEYQGALAGLEHYTIRLRRHGARPTQAPGPSVVHNHHYNNSGIANVMGPDGIASSNTNTVQVTQQTLNLADSRIADELVKLRTALAADVDDDDAAIEVGHIATAQKALKAGDESGFKAALKRLGSKAWTVAENLALAWMTNEGRSHLGLPPG